MREPKLGPKGFCHICQEPDYGNHNHSDAELSDYILYGFLPEKKEKQMHYRNGREAKNGDKIVQLGMDGAKVTASGVLFDATPGNDYCNGSIAPTHGVTSACLCDCLHVDDLAAILKEKGLDKRPEGK